MKYNMDVICTYNYYDRSLARVDPSLNIDNDDIEGLEDMSEYVYRSDFLHAFMLEDFDENSIHNTVLQLYEKMIENKEFKECLKLVDKHINIFEESNLINSFIHLCSYDYFYLLHLCICEFLKNATISDNVLNILLQKFPDNLV
jgi:hypothetical protein